YMTRDITNTIATSYNHSLVFFYQAEDGIRDKLVTGVQTCALPICSPRLPACSAASVTGKPAKPTTALSTTSAVVATAASASSPEIGRASCRERVWNTVVAVALIIRGIQCVARWLSTRTRVWCY